MSLIVPVITIGMPVFNGAKYINEAVDSLLAQTFENFELIISDNASTDNTQAIGEEYVRRDTRIRYIRQSENIGAPANFQFVLDQARGDFFMWAAADDRWDEQWIERIYSRIRSEKHIAGFGELTHIDAKAIAISHPANNVALSYGGNRLRRKIAFYLAYEGLGKANLFYAIYPRRLLQRIDLRRYCLDYQIIFDLLDQVTYEQVAGVHLYKRIHGECAGNGSSSVLRPPFVLAPFRLLYRDFQMATHYLRSAELRLGILLSLLIPVKLLVAQEFHFLRFAALLRSKWSPR